MRLSGVPEEIALHLEPAEVELFGVLLTELDDVVADTDHDTAVGRRLYPAALPGDDEGSAQFRDLTEDALRSGRRERIAACRTDLAGLPVRLVDAAVVQRWLQVLNDLRLVLGTRLGVADDGLPEPDDTDDETLAPYAVYDYLTGVQELVVQAVMGR